MEAMTVLDEGLGGALDQRILEQCLEEDRVLMTLDLDFADVRAYPPESYPGIMVFRVPRQDTSLLTSILRRVTPLLNQESVKRHLWIVEENRVRIRGGEDESE